jgi:site-specific recombinase XerD
MEKHRKEFENWQRQHIGVTEATVKRVRHALVPFLRQLPVDPGFYDAAYLLKVTLTCVTGKSPAYAKKFVSALRSYVRFLGASGLCSPELIYAIPTIPQRRLSTLPRYLNPLDVENLISSCDITTAHGVRDRAILLLLARLGLRGGDVLNLKFRDLDWDRGNIHVCGKSRRRTALPLPQDAGDAVLAYIRGARPESDSDIVFLRALAPHRPFTGSSTISVIVSLALARAGIQNPPTRGANLLRHSAATSMLRNGSSLDQVGSLLRHRSVNTTAHYAKVSVDMLREVAQPWPGAASC